jgi:hypothetical protein
MACWRGANLVADILLTTNSPAGSTMERALMVYVLTFS